MARKYITGHNNGIPGIEDARAKLEVLSRMQGTNIEFRELPVSEVFEALIRLTGKDRDKICSGCSHLSSYEPYQEGDIVEQVCWISLYPITSKGETCPYYEKLKI
jgi:hypothetical protein